MRPASGQVTGTVNPAYGVPFLWTPRIVNGTTGTLENLGYSSSVPGMTTSINDAGQLLVIGLILSVAMMGIAANVIAKYIERYRWIAWGGLLIIIYVAGKMIYDGWHDFAPTAQALVGI